MGAYNWQTQYKKTMALALPGQVMFHHKVRPYLNSAGEVAQVTIIDVGTAVASTLYTVNAAGVAVSLTSAATGDTAGTIRDKLIAALKANQSVYCNFIPEANTANSLKLTARPSLAGQAMPVTVSGGGAGFSVNNASVAAANSLPIPFGGVIAVRAGDPDGYGRLPTLATDTPVAFATLTHTHEMTQGLFHMARQEMGGLESGEIYVTLEDPAGIAPKGDVFYRHTAAPGFSQLGICSGATGAGKAQFPGAKFQGPPELVEGVYIAKVSLN